jgi:sugar lactone lactonase YvrE
MTEPQTLTTGIVFGESPRWGPDDRLWLCDWGAQEVIAVDLEGKSEVIARPAFGAFQAISIDWLPAGPLLIVSARAGRLLCREPDGTLVTHADLGRVSKPAWN